MGNCLFSGMGGGEENEAIQVVTANGGIMEFHAPVTVGLLLEEFPCHAIFKSDDLFWQPLSNHEELCPGVSYLLLPLHMKRDDAFEVKLGHVRSKSIPTATSGWVAPYRMSFDSSCQSNVLTRSNTDHVFSRYTKGGGGGGGVWKVKLAISPERLAEILSQEGRTQELIESVRTVAKCGAIFYVWMYARQTCMGSGVKG
ncbi:hypothetical protein Cgig2_015208 [Carnegiea gigantea]|uniref:Uncharacterized protein n=1 Tax=Carnegiea gigantea TaxID=171969 RepID=A0A9Q1KQB6_9CARY|nr:hypothetical protein Cgig2_015208 [Carnegiea gigantea]